MNKQNLTGSSDNKCLVSDYHNFGSVLSDTNQTQINHLPLL